MKGLISTTFSLSPAFILFLYRDLAFGEDYVTFPCRCLGTLVLYLTQYQQLLSLSRGLQEIGGPISK